MSAQYGAGLETDRPAEASASCAAVQDPAAPGWAAATGPAASWDDPLPEGKAHAAPQATTPAAAGRDAAANAADAAVAGWDDPLPGYGIPDREAGQ